jgi:hypothetical protein
MTTSTEIMNANSEKYYDMLCDNVDYIKTSNSYERLCVYIALKKYGNYVGEIWFQRKKEWVALPVPHDFMCGRHRCSLMYVDDYEGDYGCHKCGNCWENRRWIHFYGDQCNHVVDEGDYFPKGKITVGLNIFYEKQKMKLKHFSKNINC